MKWSGTFYQPRVRSDQCNLSIYLSGKIALKVISIFLVDIFQVFKTQRLQAINSLMDPKEEYEECNHVLFIRKKELTPILLIIITK